MHLDKIKSDIKELSKKKFEIIDKADRENRNLTRQENLLIAEMDGCIEAKSKNLPEPSVMVASMAGKNLLGGGMSPNSGPFSLTGPHEKKDYKSLFGTSGYQWPDNKTNFWAALFSGRHHPNLIKNSMSETTPSSGGFLVPQEQSANIHAVALENSLVLPRSYVQPMRSDSIKVPAMEIGDHSANLFGGFTASFTAELGTISEASPKARAMELNAKKLTGLIRYSSELAEDVPGGFGQIETLCGKGLSWYQDRAFLKGTGAGQPLGILNANCVVEVAKESGQSNYTIQYENLINMMARMFAGSFSNSVWVCHQTTIPQLLSLSIAIGTGGSHIPVMQESNGQFTMLTRPVLFTEKTETLGTAGDIMLADFSQYIIGLRNEIRFDTSIHVAFETDEILGRLISRFDGQPLWSESLTLADGTTTVSPFVTLAARTP